MMKLGIRMIVVSLVVSMTGCASRPPGKLAPESGVLSSVLDARVVDCTLPFLTAHAMTHATLQYRYHRGKTTFESNSPSLSAHLGQCAATSNGPDITFEREIEVWASNEN